MPAKLLDISIYRKPDPVPEPITEWTTVRVFEDGSSEQIGPRNRRRRIRLITCMECETPQPTTAFEYLKDKGNGIVATGLSEGICSWCWISINRQRQARDIQERRQARDALLRDILERPEEYRSAERRAAIIKHASPSWRDREAIAEIYAEARRLTKQTGQPHDVDHIYPLQSILGCGLHVAPNLRVVKASLNRSKSNIFPLDCSPAFNGMEYQDIVRCATEMALGLDSVQTGAYKNQSRASCDN